MAFDIVWAGSIERFLFLMLAEMKFFFLLGQEIGKKRDKKLTNSTILWMK